MLKHFSIAATLSLFPDHGTQGHQRVVQTVRVLSQTVLKTEQLCLFLSLVEVFIPQVVEKLGFLCAEDCVLAGDLTHGHLDEVDHKEFKVLFLALLCSCLFEEEFLFGWLRQGSGFRTILAKIVHFARLFC